MAVDIISYSISMKVMWPSWDSNLPPLDLQSDVLWMFAYATDLTLVLLNKLRCHSYFLFSANQITCCYKFTYLMANSADPDQLASEEAN